ncbi:MAG: hypothetical protein M1826_004970 [Phylliscum demangeonii]|nr:MAG: hypothetical protein M1826_004970 [Phylliscum demangeonii]
MAKIILSINAGSSSVKISVYSVSGSTPQALVETQIDGLTAPPCTFTYKSRRQQIQHQPLTESITAQDQAFQYMLDHLVQDDDLPEIKRREDIKLACHRIVHGGDFENAQVITSETYHTLEALTDLAPLHNASALSIVESCIKHLPQTKNVAYFDTAFHRTLPEHIRTYPIDPVVAKKKKLRKYGFHGISYAFITRSVAAHLQKREDELNMIALHLGSGASAEEILNKQSGWKALTGTTDFSKIAQHARPPSSSSVLSSAPSSDATFPASAHLAFEIFTARIADYVGSYFVALDGRVDALVFAGGIGEKSAAVRLAVVDKVRCLGFALDPSRNERLARADDSVVVVEIGAGRERPTATTTTTMGSAEAGLSSSSSSSMMTLVCWTDEQFEMARGCLADARLWNDAAAE